MNDTIVRSELFQEETQLLWLDKILNLPENLSIIFKSGMHLVS